MLTDIKPVTFGQNCIDLWHKNGDFLQNRKLVNKKIRLVFTSLNSFRKLHMSSKAAHLIFLFLNLFSKIKNQQTCKILLVFDKCVLLNDLVVIEPRREKTGFLHMRKQRRRSASR